MGNLALLQVAEKRIRAMWPEATLDVISSAPHLLRLYCPLARAITPDGAAYWANPAGIHDGILLQMPVPALRIALNVREFLRLGLPTVGLKLTRIGKDPLAQAKKNGALHTQNGSRPHAVEAAATFQPDAADPGGIDVFVATGSQYISDQCKDDAMRVLERLEIARKQGAVTAMVGQGLGPFHDPELRARVQGVLPGVDLILIRDARTGGQILSSLGICPSRVALTGDDAIEMSHQSRPASLGREIGVGFRIASYMGISSRHIQVLRPVLKEATVKYRTRLRAIPISASLHEVDSRSLGQLIDGRSRGRVAGHLLNSPLGTMKNVGRCRIVVTSTFHPAVFALAQGIPVVALTFAGQYLGKFQGLVDQFKGGCQIIRLDSEQFVPELERAIEVAWNSAEELHPQLLRSAEHMIQLGHVGYRRLFEVVETALKGVRKS